MSNPNLYVPADAQAALYEKSPLVCEHPRLEREDYELPLTDAEGQAYTLHGEHCTCPTCGVEYIHL